MLEMNEAGTEMLERGDCRILVVGVGGGGGNAVNRMIASGQQDVDFLAVNTDKQVLFTSKAKKLLIGEKLTGGRGAGGNAEVGRQAAEENAEDIKNALTGYDMIFITAGMGGGTGTGAAPVIARIASELEILTIAVVTTPFKHEMKRKMQTAMSGIEALSQHVDSLVVVSNERLMEICDARTTFLEALKMADETLRQGVGGISEIILKPGLINADFNDVRSVMEHQGFAHMGIGAASGDDKGKKAAQMAMNSPLLDTSIDGARNLLVNISGGPSLSMFDVDTIMEEITKLADPEAYFIYGALIDDELGDEIRVTVVATGFDGSRPRPVVKKVQETKQATSPFSVGTKNEPAYPMDDLFGEFDSQTSGGASVKHYDNTLGSNKDDADDGSVDLPSFLFQDKR